MKRGNLILEVQRGASLSKPEARKIVEIFFNSMADSLANGGRVEIRGLWSFYVKDYPGYTGLNPMTINMARRIGPTIERAYFMP